MLLKHGWIAWLKWFPEHRESDDERTLTGPIKPLQLMNVKSLPKVLCDNYLNDISPIMNLMEGSPEILIDSGIFIDENFINQSFEHSLNNVNRTIPHIFLKENWVNLKASYFCKMIKHSMIIRKGTESNKLRAEASKSMHKNKKKSK